ncbi:MAG: tRNA lysidine(34) synthetase TilS [Desulfomonilaceae bacterium]
MSRRFDQFSVIEFVKRTLEEFSMVKPGDKIIVGVSGGPDSTALLSILSSLAPQYSLELVVAHVNHNLRRTASHDRDFVAKMASIHGLDFFDLDANVMAYASKYHISAEEAGRRIRYNFFERLLHTLTANKIATAHHIDDQIETFLLRLLRGSSLTGLRGIPPVRGSIIRPLIKLERRQIIDYLEDKGIIFLTDETNLQSNTDRNFIRNVTLKRFENRFPNYRTPLLRTIELLTRDENFFELSTEDIYQTTISSSHEKLVIDIKLIRRFHDSLISRVVRKALYTLTGPDVRWGEIHVSKIISLIKSHNPSSYLSFPVGLRISRDYDRLILTTQKSRPGIFYRYTLHSPKDFQVSETGACLKFHLVGSTETGEHLKNNPNIAYFDYDSLSFPLEVRSYLPGDRLEPWGMRGSTKVKKIFIDKKIPLMDRYRIPIVLKNDTLLWIAGIRRSRHFGVRTDSSNVLAIEFIKPDES